MNILISKMEKERFGRLRCNVMWVCLLLCCHIL